MGPTKMGKWLAASALIALLGCSESETKPGEGDSSTRDFLIELPVEPVSSGEFLLINAEATPAGAPILLDEPLYSGLHFAIGEGYPETFEMEFDYGFNVCLNDEMTGELTFNEVSTSGDAIEVELKGPGSIDLRILGEGATTVSVTGVFTPSAEDRARPCFENFAEQPELEFTFDVEMWAHEVTGAAIDSCVTTDHVAMEVGAQIDASPLPVGRDGVAFEPANAAMSRAVTVGISADVESLEVSENSQGNPISLGDVFLPSHESTVTIQPFVGAPIRIDAVQPDQVTGIDAVFFVDGGLEGDIYVEDNATLDQELLGTARDRVFPIAALPASVGEVPYCTTLAPELFELETSTPDVCETEIREWIDYHDFKSLQLPLGFVGRAAHLKTDGRCALTFRAPTLNHGAGWSQSFEATFQDVAVMRSLDRADR